MWLSKENKIIRLKNRALEKPDFAPKAVRKILDIACAKFQKFCIDTKGASLIELCMSTAAELGCKAALFPLLEFANEVKYRATQDINNQQRLFWAFYGSCLKKMQPWAEDLEKIACEEANVEAYSDDYAVLFDVLFAKDVLEFGELEALSRLIDRRKKLPYDGLAMAGIDSLIQEKTLDVFANDALLRGESRAVGKASFENGKTYTPKENRTRLKTILTRVQDEKIISGNDDHPIDLVRIFDLAVGKLAAERRAADFKTKLKIHTDALKEPDDDDSSCDYLPDELSVSV